MTCVPSDWKFIVLKRLKALDVNVTLRDSLAEVITNGLGLHACHNCRQRRRVGLFYRLHAAEMFEQAPRGARAHARNFQQLGRAVANLAALAMECDGEAMSFIANQLNQMQHRRVMIERDGIFLLAVDVEKLLALGDGRQRLVDDLERIERFGSSV